MMETIDITLIAEETEVNAKQERTSDMMLVSIDGEGFESCACGSGKSITVSFGDLPTFPTDVSWGDIQGKPDFAEPMYWEEM